MCFPFIIVVPVFFQRNWKRKPRASPKRKPLRPRGEKRAQGMWRTSFRGWAPLASQLGASYPSHLQLQRVRSYKQRLFIYCFFNLRVFLPTNIKYSFKKIKMYHRRPTQGFPCIHSGSEDVYLYPLFHRHSHKSLLPGTYLPISILQHRTPLPTRDFFQ